MSVTSRRASSAAVTAESIAAQIDDQGLVASDAVARYAVGLGDDSLILAQRLGAWISHGPELEEDIAVGNIGLDTLGHARNFLTYAGSAWGKSEDDLAYFRGEPDFTCRQIFEQPNGDFAQTIARQLIVSRYFRELYGRLAASQDATLAAIAAKAVKEVDYHVDHSVQWLRRLALGTDYSRARMIAGLAAVWPFVNELFHSDASARDLAGVAVDPAAVRHGFDIQLGELLRHVGIEAPVVPAVRGGGRDGIHSEAFGPLLAEMQVLARAHPGASW